MNNTKKRFNIVDFVILVIILGCIVGLIVRFNIVDRIVGITENETKQVYFIARDLSTDITSALQEGDSFYCDSSGLFFGNLTELRINEGEFIYSGGDGKPAVTADPSTRDISGSFNVEGFDGENGFMIGGTQYIAPGKEMLIQSENVQISVIITEIK